MKINRAVVSRLLVLVSMSILAWTAAAAPLKPENDEPSDENNLLLTMTGSAAPPQIDGTRIQWTITASNTGTEPVTNIVLLDRLPEGLALNQVDFERGRTSLFIDGQQITITIKQLEPGQQTTISLYTNAFRRNATIENDVCLKDTPLCAGAAVSI